MKQCMSEMLQHTCNRLSYDFKKKWKYSSLGVVKKNLERCLKWVDVCGHKKPSVKCNIESMGFKCS